MSLVVENVSYEYNDNGIRVKALDNVNYEFDSGKFTAIAGHTGSGKSTLLRLLSGLDKSEGEITINGIPVTSKEGKSAVRMVFQYPEYQLFEATVLKDVMFGPKNLGLKNEEAEQEARKALLSVGFDEENFLKSPFGLSGGQKRLAAIAGILAMNPEVILLDEPTIGLDPAHAERVMKLFKDLQENHGKTIIMVSHSMDEIAEYADRMFVLKGGQIIGDGTPAEMFNDAGLLSNTSLDLPETLKALKKVSEKGYKPDLSKIRKKDCFEEILRVINCKPFSYKLL